MNRGLDATKSLEDLGEDKNAGKLDLGLSVDKFTGARAFVDYSQRITKSTYEVSAFANAYAGISKTGGNIRTDYGALAGLRIRW